MPPPALSLLTILLLHLAGSIRLHITKWCRSITVFSSSVGNTFAYLIKEPKSFLDKIFDWFNQAVSHLEDEVTLVVMLPFEEVRHIAFLLSHTSVLLVLLILTSSHF